MTEAATTTEKAEGGGKDASDALLLEAKERYKLSEEYWGPKHKLWKEDAEFRNLDQWPAEIKDARGDSRPCLVVDKCNQYVRQVVNDGRQNRPSVKVRPVDDGGDDEIAEAFQGIIRHICDRSNADEAFDTALDHAAGNGYGFFRVITDYAHKDTFNQEILVKRIRNPLAVFLDPNARAADGSDADWGFIIDELPKEKYKEKYPDAKFTNWESDSAKYGEGWLSGETVRFAEYFYKVETPRDMHLLADGTTVSDDDYQLALKEDVEPPAIKDTRNIPECEVRWCRLSGAEILEKNEWRGIYVPIIPVFGNESDIGGRVTYSGLIRAAKDPQRLYNYMRSAFAERVALTPKVPYVAAEGQVEGYENDWETANQGDKSVLLYKPTTIEGQPVPPPARQSPSDIPEGFARDMQLSEHDIQASMGMYAASLGQQSNEKSGKAIMARQREGDTATFHYQDNLNRAIRYLGRILVDLIPKIYDSKRVVRILGEDGTAEAAQINPEQQKAVQEIDGKTIYNLSVGTYDVSVSAGPSYTTKRQEAFDMMTQMVQANPQIMQFAGDLIMKAADMPYGDELAERFKLMLPPPIQQAEDAKKDGQQTPEMLALKSAADQAIAQRDQQIQEMGQALQEAGQAAQKAESDAANLKSQQQNDQNDAALKSRELDIKEFDAKTKRIQVESVGASPEQLQVFISDAMTQVGQQHASALEQYQGATGGAIQQIAQAIAQMSQGIQALQAQVQGIAEDINAPTSYERDGSGQVAAIVKGSRRMQVARGPDGRVAGIQ